MMQPRQIDSCFDEITKIALDVSGIGRKAIDTARKYPVAAGALGAGALAAGSTASGHHDREVWERHADERAGVSPERAKELRKKRKSMYRRGTLGAAAAGTALGGAGAHVAKKYGPGLIQKSQKAFADYGMGVGKEIGQGVGAAVKNKTRHFGQAFGAALRDFAQSIAR